MWWKAICLHSVRLVSVNDNLLVSARKFDTNRCLTSTNEMLVANRWPTRSLVFDFLLCISRAHSQLVQLNRSLRNVISFPTNIRARHFKSIVVLRYATSNLPRHRFLLDFAFFAARCAEARDVANEPTLLQAGKKDQREIRIMHANADKRESIGISCWKTFRCAFSEMRQKNEFLHATHRRKYNVLYDFR